ncbi:MAG: hypothetical protein ACREKL_02610 [Chthoniobacterales bacterium]
MTALPDPKPKRRRRWLRRLLGVAVLVALALAVAFVVAARNLEWIAKWTIHRAFPGVKVEMDSLSIVSATRLEVRKLELKSSKTGELLLALEDGTAVFSFGDVWRLRLDELHLKNPNLVVSPDLGDALGVKPGGPEQKKSGGTFGWGIGRFVVTDGHLRVTRFGEQSPTIDMDVSADLKNFGAGVEAGAVEHFVRLEKIVAWDIHNQPMLRVADADLRFTTDELFSHDRVRSVRIGRGDLTIGPALINSFSSPSKSAPPQAPTAQTKSGWSVGSLQLDGLAVAMPDAPGFIGRTNFRIAAALRDVGTADAKEEQRVTLTDVGMATDRTPGTELLTAASAEARFSVAGLAAGHIEEITLKDPVVDFSPRDMAQTTVPAASSPPAPTAKAGEPVPMSIGRLHCDYGALRLRDLQDGTLGITAKFSFDLKNFGTTGEASTTPQELTIWDAQAASGGADAFTTLDIVQVHFTAAGLLRQHIDAVNIAGGRLLIGSAIQKLLAAPAAQKNTPSQPVAASAPLPGWSIGSLDISRVRTRIEDKRPGLTELRFTLNTALRNVEASGVTSQVLDEVQTVELANIDLRSPLNASAKIFSLRSVFVRFTLRDLAQKHLREIVILRPTIYLSQDLFVYMERVSAPDANAATAQSQAAPAGSNWAVDHLDVKFGRLVIGGGATSDVGVPIEFETSADNFALDDLARLQLKTALRVPKQNYENSNYQISIEDIEGDLRFSYPPDKGEKNLVQKLEMKSARWRQFRSMKPWIAVTFDASGINGLFGGEAYDGYLNGGFSFMFEQDSPWVGWISGTDIATKQLTDIMAPQNFRMTGPLTFEVQFDAFRKSIDRVKGMFKVTEPGTLKVGKLDDLLANIPPEWTAIKQSSTRIALETLRDFDYTSGSGDFWFVQSQGIMNLDLKGPLGSRRFETVLHDGQETDSKWQQGKLGKE